MRGTTNSCEGNEETQPGNPHQLTVKQHVLSRSCIKAFANEDGKVEVFDKTFESIALRDPNEPRFYVRRVWDQRAEEYSEREIERPYLSAVQEILNRHPPCINTEDQRAISAMYGLWRFRAHLRLRRPSDIQLNLDVPPNNNGWTTDEAEQLEKAGFVFTLSDNSIPGRLLAWPQIQRYVQQTVSYHEKFNWVAVIPKEGQFICPDSPPVESIFPCTPDLCFVMVKDTGGTKVLERNTVSQINRHLAENADAFYFARSISQCPFPIEANAENSTVYE